MVSNLQFLQLITAASLAPSADNMQAWEFRRRDDQIIVYYAKNRALPHDCYHMFGYIGLGAAIQNIEEEAVSMGFALLIDTPAPSDTEAVALLTLKPISTTTNLSAYVPLRKTNRMPFDKHPISVEILEQFQHLAETHNTHLCWTQKSQDFQKISQLDASFSYIRLAYKPFHDELFSILRFSDKEMESIRYGLTFESLEVPQFAVYFAKQLQHWSFNQLVSQLGFGKMVAKKLSQKLNHAGAILYLSVSEPNKQNFMEAGRALEKIWLLATKMNLSIQPYGVLPQYFNKAALEPESLLPEYVEQLKSKRIIVDEIFPNTSSLYPAMLLRVGETSQFSVQNAIRLKPEQLIH